MPLSDQLKQLVELHKVTEQAMKGLIVRLWPTEAMPGSYFGLVRQLVEACRALAHAKVHWGKMDADKLVMDVPPPAKEYRKPEMYYEGILKGARLIAGECSKDVIFE